tara:strand:+ start:231 stop:875 length:645 start_codon:yes stop_codon:yes gene_type:complete
MNSLEKKHVKVVYDQIAENFSDTRFCIWQFVKDFLHTKTSKMKGIDIGCGNGKNIGFNTNLNIIGVDNCEKLLEICKAKELEVVSSDCCALPFDTNTFDYAISIAVYHHMVTRERRYTAVEEMIRVLKPGATGLISVWSVENQSSEKIKRNFIPGKNYVNWTDRKKQIVYQRYYYIFTEEMIYNWINYFKHTVDIERVYNERGNWIIIIKKKQI